MLMCTFHNEKKRERAAILKEQISRDAWRNRPKHPSNRSLSCTCFNLGNWTKNKSQY